MIAFVPDVEMTRIANATTESEEHEEIEVTAEMIEAGEEAILSHPGVCDGIGYFSVRELAMKVFLAMNSRRCVGRDQSR